MKKKLLLLSFVFLFLFTSISNCLSYKLECYPFKAKPLPYNYDTLEPYISKDIMTLHHDKHYQTYVENLNKTLSDYPKYQCCTLNDLLTNLDKLPKEIATPIKNNAGGVYNHEFFFDIMTPNKTQVSGELKDAINRDFSSYDNFINEFKKSALSVFGSGWAWLVKDSEGQLLIVATPNQDSPVSLNLQPIIGIDVWEHAYYLQYKNKRSDYVNNWINVINWDKALENFNSSK